MKTIEELEARLAKPSNELVEDISSIDGDIMLLGVGGKMGPSLARLALNAIKQAGVSKKVIGVSRFSDPGLKADLEHDGVETLTVDLLDDQALQQIAEVKNIIYMAGTKFGTTGNEHFTWAMNAYLPGRVAEKFRHSRMVVFSTGNVYPFMPVISGGATEETDPGANGEYGMSCLGRERLFEYFSRKYEIPMVIYRLNYAIDLRYGVLLEIAKAVKSGTPINVTMGHANVIWQGDANERALRCLKVCSTPPAVYNISGPETISLRWAAQEFAKRLNTEANVVGEEAPTALLSNCSKSFQAFGYPQVSLTQMIDWVADWVLSEQGTWNKPTHFNERDGKF
jgi:nucleoside-diphosphate-sugar epimerase